MIKKIIQKKKKKKIQHLVKRIGLYYPSYSYAPAKSGILHLCRLSSIYWGNSSFYQNSYLLFLPFNLQSSTDLKSHLFNYSIMQTTHFLLGTTSLFNRLLTVICIFSGSHFSAFTFQTSPNLQFLYGSFYIFLTYNAHSTSLLSFNPIQLISYNFKLRVKILKLLKLFSSFPLLCFPQLYIHTFFW